MANIALVLEAEIIAFAPPLGLVVKQTPRVETQITADGTVLPVGRPGNRRRGLGNRRIISLKIGMGRKICELHPGADTKPAAFSGNLRDRHYGRQVNHGFGFFDATPDIDDHVGAAGEVARCRIRCLQLDGLSGGFGTVQVKFGHVFHMLSPIPPLVRTASRALYLQVSLATGPA